MSRPEQRDAPSGNQLGPDLVATSNQPAWIDAPFTVPPTVGRPEPVQYAGVSLVAKWCGVVPTAVTNWLSRYSGYPAPIVEILSATGVQSHLGWALDSKDDWIEWASQRRGERV